MYDILLSLSKNKKLNFINFYFVYYKLTIFFIKVIKQDEFSNIYNYNTIITSSMKENFF